MPATRYKVVSVPGAVGKGITVPIYVNVTGIAKTNAADHPYVVANELICTRLAQVLLLPIPPGFMIQHNSLPYYVSLDFNLSGHQLPPASPSALMSAQPLIGAGVLAFDAWVVNTDRHRNNLAFDTTTKQVQIFDHSHALYATDGTSMKSHENDIGFLQWHCLAGELRSLDDILTWCDRITSIPDYYIRAVVDDTIEEGLPQAAAAACYDFLIERRTKLPDLFSKGVQFFPKLNPKPGTVGAPGGRP
jgi:hypothetical protein